MKRNKLTLFIMVLLAALVIPGCKKEKNDTMLLMLAFLANEKPLVLENFQEASLVLGQEDFITSVTPTAAMNTFFSSYSLKALKKGGLFVPDYNFNRVMMYDEFPTENNQDADRVLGQEDFISTDDYRGGTPDAFTTLSRPIDVSSYGRKFAILEYGSNRLLLYSSIPDTYNAEADVVVGQPNFETTTVNTGGISAATLSSPCGVFIGAGKLIVSDSDNNRLLVYNSIPDENGASADVVLGQGDFVHYMYNDDNQDNAHDGVPSARTLYYPVSAWTDGKILIVSDNGNNRVLIWNSFPTENFQGADVVVGQSSMTTRAHAAGADGMYHPWYVTSYAGQLFVADSDNNRLLGFNSIPEENGASADVVLGQGDFVHNTSNDDDQNDVADSAPSARTLNWPLGISVTDGMLFVTDYYNYRVLMYESQE